jgi:hypothetical protein
VSQRLKRNPSLPSLWLHVVLRFVSLLALGLILANAEKVDHARTGMSGSLWALLGIVCGALYLNVYPKSSRFPAYSTVLRGIGLTGAVILFAIFRRKTEDGQIAWIDFSYPEILGLIAFSYLACCLLYIPTRRLKRAAMVWFVLLAALCVGTTGRWIPVVGHLPLYVWPFSNGAMGCLIMAGVVVSQVFLGADPSLGKRPAPKSAIIATLAFGAACLIAGWLLVPLGISKIRATPSWALWSIGAAAIIYAFLYWLCDLKGQTSWAFLLKPAGANTLTTYLLPDLWDFALGVLGITWFDSHFPTGAPVVIKTILFTIFILLLARLLTRAKVRLAL